MLSHNGPNKIIATTTTHSSPRTNKRLVGALLRCVQHVLQAVRSPSHAASLDRGWIIANHKLVSFHAAFLSSLMSISTHVASRLDVLRQMFLSAEVVISCAIWYAAWHCNIAIHEIGHYITAVKTNNLRPELAGPAEEKLKQGTVRRWLWYLEMFVKIPYGAFKGVNKEAGSYHPSVKTQNLAVSAAGPKASLMLCYVTFLPGIALFLLGLYSTHPLAVYVGRFLFAIGVVALFDFLLADSGKYKAFRDRQREAAAKRVLGFTRDNATPVYVTISSVLDDALHLLASHATGKKLNIAVRNRCSDQVETFPGELRQIFVNLLENAIDAAPPGGHIVIHTSSCCRKGKAHVKVAIADNGPGIRKEHQSRVFDPFFTTKGSTGTGIGLWVTRGLVEKYGGCIRFRSAPRYGTCFAVLLPTTLAP
jgi:hypothetical protein